jgi:RsiW-degrading membrane proteinase PrsW (M82 family)
MFFLYPLVAVNYIYMAAAIIPAILLLKYIYDIDKFDKEPPILLAKLFVFGMISVIPAILLEKIMQMVIGQGSGKLYYMIYAFLGVAIIEEGVKLFALKHGSFHERSFDYMFDGIVYAVFVSLGFAVVENIMYVYSGGIGTAFVRALTSIPGHMCFAIPMGFFYSKAKRQEVRGKGYGLYMLLAWLVPMIFHGIYDYVLMVNDTWSFILVLALVYLILFSLAKQEKKDEPI